MKLLARSNSFKRRVKSGQVSAPADKPDASKMLIKGEVQVSHEVAGALGHGKSVKFIPGFAVAYAGVAGGVMIALHKSVKDFTPFRAFPEDVSYLSSSRRVAEATPSASKQHCLQLEGDSRLAQPRWEPDREGKRRTGVIVDLQSTHCLFLY